MSIHADALELVDAWRTMSGENLLQDYSHALSLPREYFLNLDMGYSATMVWQLTDDFPKYAKKNALHSNESVT